jgi:hypothetical protein
MLEGELSNSLDRAQKERDKRGKWRPEHLRSR